MNLNLTIARSVRMKPIMEIASQLDLGEEEVDLYGRYKAKIHLDVLRRLEEQKAPAGKLILVTAITPTPAGEGKTTTTIGLSQGLNQIGKRAISATREPAMGPVFGIKGGAAGGGYSQVLPMEDINLHFTGDMHAITAAHNLLATMLDNSLHQGNPHRIDLRSINLRRAIDMNDRSLRDVVVGLGGKGNGFPRESGFQITPASEVMAVLCLSRDILELKARLGRIVLGQTFEGAPVTAADMKAHGAMAAILRDALKPNLVQTIEGTPALVHGGPFGNIAHGCSSIVGTLLGLRLADYCVTEAGFGSDLGAEKFFNIVCRSAGIRPDAVVIVASVRALKLHGGRGLKELEGEDVSAVEKGLANLEHHMRHMQQYGVPVVVAVNRFRTDTDAEVDAVVRAVRGWNARVAACDVYGQGGKGAVELAEQVVEAANTPSDFRLLYDASAPLRQKVETLARSAYGADGVRYQEEAEKKERWLTANGFDKLPLCVAKTQYSLSDDPDRRGAPRGYQLRVRDYDVSAGAGFIIVYSGSILVLPGLPRIPSAEAIDIDENGEITGLF